MKVQASNQNLPPANPVIPTPPMNKPIYKNKLFLGFVAISALFAFLIGGYFLGKNSSKQSPEPTASSPSPTPNQTVCAQDVKECPDGSFVSREGPNCEFAPCSGEFSDDDGTAEPEPVLNPDLNTYRSSEYGFIFQYPKSLFFNNSSRSDFISLLQRQGDLNAQRLSVQVNKSSSNLQDFAKSKGYNVLEGKGLNLNGDEGFAIYKTFKIGQVCNNGDDTEVTRVDALFAKGDGLILTFIPNDSCDTLKTDWFSVVSSNIHP